MTPRERFATGFFAALVVVVLVVKSIPFRRSQPIILDGNESLRLLRTTPANGAWLHEGEAIALDFSDRLTGVRPGGIRFQAFSLDGDPIEESDPLLYTEFTNSPGGLEDRRRLVLRPCCCREGFLRDRIYVVQLKLGCVTANGVEFDEPMSFEFGVR